MTTAKSPGVRYLLLALTVFLGFGLGQLIQHLDKEAAWTCKVQCANQGQRVHYMVVEPIFSLARCECCPLPAGEDMK